MPRIFTLFILMALSLSSFAQLSVTVEDSNVCSGESVWFAASGMDLYAWSDTVNLDTNFGDTVHFSATSAGVYAITLLGYSIVPLDTDTLSFSVTVNTNPTVNITSSAGTAICDGASTELVATGGYDAYMWTPSATLDNDSTDTVIATPTSATTYHVMVTDSNGCMGMDSISLTLTSGPSVSISSSTDADNGYLCEGNTATMTASGTGIASYEWSPTASLNDSTSATVQATPSATTTYTVVVTDSSGCTASESIEITVNDVLPSLTINLDKDTICYGASTEINVQSNGTSFSWSPGGSLDDPTSKDVVASPTTTTTYTVTATRLGCTRTESVTVNVLPEISISASQSSGGATICLDETDVITVDCAECASYIWKFPNSSLTTAANVQTVSPNNSGAIQIVITGVDAIGCTNKATVTVNVDSCFVGTPFGLPERDIQPVKLLNQGDQFTFVSPDAIISDLKLFNIIGEEVLAVRNSDNDIVVSTSELSSGMYIARLTLDGREVVEKIYLR